MDTQFPMKHVPLNSAFTNPRRRANLAKTVIITAMLIFGALAFFAPVGRGKQKQPQKRTLTGVVQDEADNGIEGATVELTDLQTEKVLAIYSQQGGHYQFSDLNFSHDYKVKATFRGSSSEVRQVSSLDSRPIFVLNLTIPGSKH